MLGYIFEAVPHPGVCELLQEGQWKAGENNEGQQKFRNASNENGDT